MNITVAELANNFDLRFIRVLKNAYVPAESITKTKLAQQIEPLLLKNNYSPNVPRFIIDYDKGHGVSRPVPVFEPKDYGVYYYCMKKLEDNIAFNRVEGTYGGWSLGGKLRELEKQDQIIEDIDYPMTASLSPEAWSRFYGEYISKITKYIESLEGEYLIVELDIANFYDTIRLDILEHKIRLVSRKENATVIDLLFHFLKNSNKQINSFVAQSTGIPQDMIADCSRLLANFYLQDYDTSLKKYCDSKRIKYLRYADDQLLFIPKEINYKTVVKVISNLLYKIGLNVNQKKVNIYEVKELLLYRAVDIFNNLEPGKSNQEQSEVMCRQFASETISAISDPNRKLKNKGASLLRKAIGMGLYKLKSTERERIFNLILSDDYLPYLDHIKLCQLYDSLNNKQKSRLFVRLKEEAQCTTQSAFFYECAKFSKIRSIGMSRYFTAMINQYNKQWTTT